MAKARIGINGFGRIGRGFARALAKSADTFDLVLINDLTDANTLGHLLQYDSVHGKYPATVSVENNFLVIGDDRVEISSVRDPAEIPWAQHGVDIVLECTGRFSHRQDASKHLSGHLSGTANASGAKKVIISAPAKSPDITLAYGINLQDYQPDNHHIISNASCTTNCLAPVAKVLHDAFGIQSGIMTTVHSYTNDQKILDLPHKDLRRARAAGLSMIPTTTGAAKALQEVLPELTGKLDGMAIRVPTPNVSLVDLTVSLQKKPTEKEINQAFAKAEATDLAGVLATTTIPLVSCDYNGNTASATVDLPMTKVIGDLTKVIAWYDNETGYAQRLFDVAAFVANTL